MCRTVSPYVLPPSTGYGENTSSLATAENNAPNAKNLVFRNNVFIRCRMQTNTALPHTKLYNNTFYNSLDLAENFSLLFRTTKGRPDGARIYNNLYIRSESSKSAGFHKGMTGAANMLADNNMFSNADSTNSGKTIDTKNKEGGTIEANSLNTGPAANAPTDLFVDPAKDDLRLKVGSPAIGAGKDLSGVDEGFTNDVTGATRVGWDIGAYAFKTGSPSPAPTPQPPTNLRVTGP